MKKYFSYSLFIIILISFFAPFFLPKANAQEPGCTQLDEYGAEVPCSRVYGDSDQLHTAIPIGAQYAASTPAATTEDTSYHLLQPLPCSGNEKAGCDKNGQFSSFQPSGTAKLAEYLNLMLTLFIGLCAVAAVVMIVVGGIQYSTAELVGGKEEAKNRMLNAIFGLVLALGSYAILYTINPDLLRTDFDVGGASVTSKGEQLAKDLANPKPQEIPPSQQSSATPDSRACANISDKKVLMIGDSLVGDCDATGKKCNPSSVGLKGQIAAKVSKGNFFYSGFGGATTGGQENSWVGNNRLTNALNKAGGKPDVVFVVLGTNDAGGSNVKNPAIMTKYVKTILNSIPSSTIVYWIGPPSWPDRKFDIAASEKIISDATQPYKNVYFFDSQSFGCASSGCKDGHDLNKKNWANGIWQWCSGK